MDVVLDEEDRLVLARAFALAVVLAACGSAPAATAATPTPAPAPPHEAVALPDLSYTPGNVISIDAAKVCVSGYTKTVRVSLTIAERDQVNAHYHWTYTPGAQEYDHLIPLELGGGNGVSNIWPEPIVEAHIKDRLENELHAKTCSGALAITDAQRCIAVDWYQCAIEEKVVNEP